MGCPVHTFADADVSAGPPPVEVLRYWRDKNLEPGFDYRDVWESEHDHAFTAAKVMRADVLEGIQAHLETAFADGQTYRDWSKDVESTLRELGWWEPQKVVDPETGKTVTVKPPHRLETIFQTNMRTARAVGQRERIERNVRSRPYLVYTLGPSARHRPEHLAWHGLTLPVDDPFWGTHWPPNGWRCKCGVRAVSETELGKLKRDGIRAPDAKPILDDEGNPTGHVENKRIGIRTEAPKIELVPWENKRTGSVEMVPQGIDPGFAHKPGDGR